jgi:hypothetical protein
VPSENQLARCACYLELLEQPDPPELAGRRGHHLTVDGRPDRHEALVIPNAIAYLQWARLERDDRAWMA